MEINRVKGRIVGINGPIVKAEGLDDAGILDVVYVGKKQLIGEIIKLDRGVATIQVYEENSMMGIGEEVISNKRPLSVFLGPGLLESIYDGIQRPLKDIFETTGDYLPPGVKTEALDIQREWHFFPFVKTGEPVFAGMKIGYVKETEQLKHYIMVPPYLKGRRTISKIVSEGDYTILEPVVVLDNGLEIRMSQYWPVREMRPYKEKLNFTKPLITGQRVIDTFFPLAKGGAAAIPGGFGTGKTMTQHALAKFADAQIIVYIGCGERGNEMTDVLNEFSELIDPTTNQKLMKRTILIANTSNMPVAAREVSIYTGITIAEYYRDMGYDVAIMADSTSRWAEALRELSGRLEEMPAEEGFPSYLPTRLAEFYERAGCVKTFQEEVGSISVIGAVSPAGGDFSEPVTQQTKRFTRCFWALDKALANARHFPAISWLDSYSEYIEETKTYWNSIADEAFETREEAVSLLKRDDKLSQIVRLVGADSLPDNQKLILYVADIIKKGFLQQNAYDEVDRYTTPEKQAAMLHLIMQFYHFSEDAIQKGATMYQINNTGLGEEIIRLKYDIANEDLEKFDEFFSKMKVKLDFQEQLHAESL